MYSIYCINVCTPDRYVSIFPSFHLFISSPTRPLPWPVPAVSALSVHMALPRRCRRKRRCLALRWIRRRPPLFSPSPCWVAHRACPGPGLWFQGLCLSSVERETRQGEDCVTAQERLFCAAFRNTHNIWGSKTPPPPFQYKCGGHSKDVKYNFAWALRANPYPNNMALQSLQSNCQNEL